MAGSWVCSFGERMKAYPRGPRQASTTPRGKVERWYRARRMGPNRQPASPWVWVSIVGLAAETLHVARATLRFALGHEGPNGLKQWGGPWQFERLDSGPQVTLQETKSGNGATVYVEKF